MEPIVITVPQGPKWPPEENNKHVDVDGDMIVYRCAYACEDENLTETQKTMDGHLKDIIWGSKCGSWTIHLTGQNNFRKEIATIQPYKGNRDDKDKPKYYQYLRDYLVDFWGAIVHEDFEADDALSISHYYTMNPSDSCYVEAPYWAPPTDKQHVIATLDKDLYCVQGATVYNWNHEEFTYSTETDANRFFFKQCLTGDPVDHIKGLGLTRPESKLLGERSVGPKNPWAVAIDDLEDSRNMYQLVLGCYELRMESLQGCDGELTEPLARMLEMGPEAALLENARLLHMQRYIGELWEPPSE